MSATRPGVIIITGAPGTGKTTVGRQVAQTFRLPFIHKDGIKEMLFDSLGWKDRAWSKRLGIASMDLLFYLAGVELQAGRSFIVESNFYPQFDTPRFLALQQHPFSPFQILCTADAEELVRRYEVRVTASERHPGHLSQLLLQEFDAETLLARHSALGIGGQVYRVDTSNPIDYDGLFQAIASELENV